VYRSLRRRPDIVGLLRARLVHLLGMNETTTHTAPAFLTQHELSELLRLSERTLEDWRLTHSGPPFLKLGRHVRYDMADVLRWVGDQRRG
jgi:hypothetical protein